MSSTTSSASGKAASSCSRVRCPLACRNCSAPHRAIRRHPARRDRSVRCRAAERMRFPPSSWRGFRRETTPSARRARLPHRTGASAGRETQRIVDDCDALRENRSIELVLQEARLAGDRVPESRRRNDRGGSRKHAGRTPQDSVPASAAPGGAGQPRVRQRGGRAPRRLQVREMAGAVIGIVALHRSALAGDHRRRATVTGRR